tara:strand:+ start:602 stop:823 length:222 start_codon:yes stop_codon:yes gene_type:complete
MDRYGEKIDLDTLLGIEIWIGVEIDISLDRDLCLKWILVIDLSGARNNSEKVKISRLEQISIDIDIDLDKGRF